MLTEKVAADSCFFLRVARCVLLSLIFIKRTECNGIESYWECNNVRRPFNDESLSKQGK